MAIIHYTEENHMWPLVIQGAITIMQLLPSVLNAVRVMSKGLEEESPSGGGDVQKEVLIGVVREGLDAADKLAPDGQALSQGEKEAIIQVAGKATDLMVGMYNTLGVFKKTNG